MPNARFDHRFRKQRPTGIAPPAIFRALIPHFDPPEIHATWAKFLETSDPAARAALIKFYAPLVLIEVAQQKRWHPELFVDPIADLVNDGALGLMRKIDNTDGYFPGLTRARIRREIRRTARREVYNRMFGLSHAQTRKIGVIAHHRGAFIQEHGRLPDKIELAERLFDEFKNPNIALECAPWNIAEPLEDRRAIAALRDAPSREPSPDQRVFDREAVRLAFKGMESADRPILKMLLKGLSPAEIARKLGITYWNLQKRLNGVLWIARSRADLARYLGETPMQPPKSMRKAQARAIPARQPASPRRAGLMGSGSAYSRTCNAAIGGEIKSNLAPQVWWLGLSELPARELPRADRTDAEIVELLHRGYSQNAILRSTRGKTKIVRVRIRDLQRSLIAQLKMDRAEMAERAAMVAG